MVRSERIKNYLFSLGSLTANADGLFETFSQETLNGTIQSISMQANSYTTTGSVLIFASGLLNSGTNTGDLLLKIRAGSSNQTFYPAVYGELSSNTTGSPQAFFHPVLNNQIRIVGSGLGNATSGLGIQISYI